MTFGLNILEEVCTAICKLKKRQMCQYGAIIYIVALCCTTTVTAQTTVTPQNTPEPKQTETLTSSSPTDTIITEKYDTIYRTHIDTVINQRIDTVYNTYVDSSSINQDTVPAKTEILALKNNLAYDAIFTPNLEIEFRLHKHWTMEFGAGVDPFPLKDDKFPKWRHFSVWVAPRYWFCNAFNRGFLSANVAYAHYNVAGNAWPVSWMYKQVKDNRYQGDAVMFGVSGGWHFAISPHFSIELEAGVDAGHTWFNRYECKHCGQKLDEKATGWFALPKIGISLVVPLGGDKLSFKKRCDCEDVEDEPIMITDTLLVTAYDTIIPAPKVDTIVLVTRDTIIPEPVIVEPEEPVMDTHSEEMQKLRAGVFRDDSEYVPYTTDMALSSDPRNVFLFFETNVTILDRNFLENAKTLDSIAYLIGDALQDPTIEITHIQIVGFASFDGRQSYNEKLAGGRAQAMKEFLQGRYPELDDSYFALCNGGESWAELRYLFSQDTFAERQEVLDIIDHEPNLDKREQLIKKLYGGDTYKYIRKEYKKQLRNLGCIMVYVKLKD